MTSKIVSFKIVQGYAAMSGDAWNGKQSIKWTPDVIALCEDGSLWMMSLSSPEEGWKLLHES